jgi:Glycosyl transferase family 11
MYIMSKIIARIKGGLGNQLFCYAAARRLALINNAELVIDDVTGFQRDYQYQRKYALDCFHIPARKATPSERLEPLERYRRGWLKWVSLQRPFAERSYLDQEGIDFDERILTFKVRKTIYLDACWQSEKYFKDVENIIREDLQITPPQDSKNQQIADKIRNCTAVAVHVRLFDDPTTTEVHDLSSNYYKNAIELIEKKVKDPHYFLFSDTPEAAITKVNLPKDRVTCVSNNTGDENAYADLWLMSQCQHFITANSTFSWWAAWLSSNPNKIVATPLCLLSGGIITAWNFDGLIPENWYKIKF